MTIQRRIISVLLVLLIVLTGCGPNSDEPVDTRPPVGESAAPQYTQSAPPSQTDEKITLTLLEYSREVQDVRFRSASWGMSILSEIKGNPAVENISLKLEDAKNNDQYLNDKTTLLNEILAGKGPDIIIGADLLFEDLYAAAVSGAFADLKPYLDYEPTFDQNDYFSDVFDCGVIGDSRFFIPYAMGAQGAWIVPHNKANASGIPYEGVGLQDFVSSVKEKTQQIPDANFVWRDAGYYGFDIFGLKAYDFMERKSLVLTPEFRSGIEAVRDFMNISSDRTEPDEERAKKALETDYLGYSEDEIFYDSEIFSGNGTFFYGMDLSQHFTGWSPKIRSTFLQEGEVPYCAALPQAGTSSKTYARPEVIAAISNNCEYKAEATEILKIGLELRKDRLGFEGMVDVRIISSAPQDIGDFLSSVIFSRENYKPYIALMPEEDYNAYMVPMFESVRSYIGSINAAFFKNDVLEDMIREEFKIYIDGEITTDQFVNNLDIKLKAYFATGD